MKPVISRHAGLVHIKPGQALRGPAKLRPASDKFDPPPMSQAEVLKWWRITKQDYWYVNQMRVSAMAIGAVLGMTMEAARNALDRGVYPDKTLDKVARLIPAIEARTLIFPWKQGRGSGDLPYFMWVAAPEFIPKLSSLSVLGAWSLFARCRACDGNKWLPVKIAGEPKIVCYQCLPPERWPSVGASGVTKRLIAEACRKL